MNHNKPYITPKDLINQKHRNSYDVGILCCRGTSTSAKVVDALRAKRTKERVFYCLERVFASFKDGGTIRVAALGGSITTGYLGWKCVEVARDLSPGGHVLHVRMADDDWAGSGRKANIVSIITAGNKK